MEIMQQGYDAELQLAVDALQQILQVRDAPCSVSQDTTYAGPPAGYATPGVTPKTLYARGRPQRLTTECLLRMAPHAGNTQGHHIRALEESVIGLNGQSRL
ncbi:hypothetical protein NDU88_005927 [Pleurodeles waltl]|uniref:Uncharacterized protein n=1 Tax=Pleurodeles waltl TaxID=8319 RepID=A0AAV7TCP8_PLEWA|nr:hypothetical protein NDU88_005927 [Pleurodeles waltl]